MDITVIIPAYNEESVIEGTLKSLPKDIEIIVICNGCTDKTAEIAKKYAKVIEIEKKGVANARNQGAKVATYDKLVFLDADVQVDENVIGQILDTKANIGTTKVKPNNNNLIDKIMMFLKSKIHRFGFNTGLIFCTKEIYNKIFQETFSKC